MLVDKIVLFSNKKVAIFTAAGLYQWGEKTNKKKKLLLQIKTQDTQTRLV